MKEILEALSSLSGLEPLIALLTAADPGSAYVMGECLQVAPDDQGQTISLKDGQDSPLFRVRTAADHITLQQLSPAFAVPQALATWLRLVGTGEKGHPIAQGARIRDDEYIRRLETLEHAWCVTHHFARLPSGLCIDRVEAVLTLARDVRMARDRLFELENTSNTSPSRLRQAREAVQAAGAQLKKVRDLIGDEAAIQVCDDPRGSSLKVIREGVDGFTIYLTGANLNWAPVRYLELLETPSKVPSKARKVAAATHSAQPIGATSVAPEIQVVLQKAVANGNELQIAEQLDPATYAKVKRLLASLGGRWVSRRQVHVFDREVGPIIAEALGGSLVTDRDWDFFPTPPELVQLMLQKADLKPGIRVLEPQAGQAAIAGPVADLVGKENVDCVEAMPRNAECLRQLGFSVIEADFLSLTPKPDYGLILMNPPFANMRDIAHITHAMKFLQPGGKLVSYASGSWRHRESLLAAEFQALLDRHGAEIEEIPAGAFRASGTEVATVLITMYASKDAATMDHAKPVASSKAVRAAFTQVQLDMFAA